VSTGGSLALVQGFSKDVHLTGEYDLVIHEILGHVASSEGAAAAILDLRSRALATADCRFVPLRARTLLTPTERVELSTVERVLQMQLTNSRDLLCKSRYLVENFPANLGLAAPGVFESLDFAGDLHASQDRLMEFVTDRAAVFDGVHLHMEVDVDDVETINTWTDATSWSTTYIRLLDPGVYLPAGSRIVVSTSVDLRSAVPRYSIKVRVGDIQVERLVSAFSWSGC
jgi:hypothetical protein